MIDYFITLIIHLSQSLEQCYRTIISEEIRGSDLKLKTFYSFDFRVEKPHPSTRFPSGTLGGRGAAFRYEDQVKYTQIPKISSLTNMDCSLARPVSLELQVKPWEAARCTGFWQKNWSPVWTMMTLRPASWF